MKTNKNNASVKVLQCYQHVWILLTWKIQFQCSVLAGSRNQLLMVATLRQIVTAMSSCVTSLTCPDSHLSWTNHLRRTDVAPTPGLATQTRCSREGNKHARGVIKHGEGHFTLHLLDSQERNGIQQWAMNNWMLYGIW